MTFFRRILVPSIIFCITFVLTFFIGQKLLHNMSARAASSASLSLSASSVNPQVDQSFVVGVGLDSGSNIVGADVVVYFDSRYLEVVGVNLGNTNLKTLVPGTDNTVDLTKSVYLNPTDPAKSTVEIGLITFDQSSNLTTTPVTGNYDASSNPIAQITFKAKAMGSSNLSIKFDGNAVTTDSNVVTNDSGLPEDILTQPQTPLAIGVILACSTVDLNTTGNITIGDVQAVSARWGTATGDPNYDTKFDLDQSGLISIKDVQLVSSRWGEQCL